LSDELGFFQLYFPDKLILECVANTNAYAATKSANTSLRPNSIWNKWSDVTADELNAYFGVIMNMAINDKPSVFDYFSLQ